MKKQLMLLSRKLLFFWWKNNFHFIPTFRNSSTLLFLLRCLCLYAVLFFPFIIFYYKASEKEEKNTRWKMKILIYFFEPSQAKTHRVNISVVNSIVENLFWQCEMTSWSSNLLSYQRFVFKANFYFFVVPKISAPKNAKLNLKIKLCNFPLNVVRTFECRDFLNQLACHNVGDVLRLFVSVCVCVWKLIFLNFLCFRRIFHRHHTISKAFVELLLPFLRLQKKPPARNKWSEKFDAGI